MGQIVFQATLGGQVAVAGPNTASSFTLTLPAATDTLVGKATTDTLTNKTLTSPTITGATLTTSAFNGTVGATTPSTGAFTTLSTSSTTTLSGLTASTALALDASKNVVSVTNTGTGNNVLSASPTLTGTIAGASLSLSSLTSGRVTYATTSGLLTDSANLKFNGTDLQLTAGNLYWDVPGVRYIANVGDGSSNLNIQSRGNTIFSYGGATVGAGTEAMRITSAGLVGIGTSSPATKLDVTGSIHSTSSFLLGTATDGTTGQFATDNTNNYLDYLGSLIFRSAAASSEKMRIDSSGNLGLGVTPSTWAASRPAFEQIGGSVWSFGTANFYNLQNAYFDSVGFKYKNTAAASSYQQGSGIHYWYNAASGTAGNAITFTQAMTLDASGNLLVGTTSGNARLRVLSTASQSQAFYVTHPTSGNDVISCENSATTGNNNLIAFYTDATVARGLISYNRASGLVVYGTTSDYRAKDISGPVTDSGALIDSVPVYMGTMKGATQARPMFIAHETPDYAHTGEKDAVDKDGKPIYQQMDASSLIPVMWAEIQSLRQRIKTLENK